MMPRFLALRWLGLALLVGGFPAPACAENYAFLVGVQDYDAKDLKKLNFTRSDIEEFGKVLQKSGFKRENVVVMSDKPEKGRYMADASRIRTELDLVLGTIESQDTLIVAFSGHGVQFEGEEKNYYCPLDADLEDPQRKTLIPLSELYEKLKKCPAERKLLLVDACRNDPLSPVKKSRQTVRLNSITRPQIEPVPKGLVALFSCAAGQESYEWPDLKHGVFFYHVLEAWNGAAAGADKHITLDAVVAYSKQKTQTFVRLNLKALQTPQVKSDFEGTWVLRTLATPDLGSPTKSGASSDGTRATPPATEEPAGLSRLFNGKDPTGWEGNLSLWKVENGMLVGESPGVKRNQFLATTTSFGDFELRLEFRLRDGIGNSGIQFRSQRVPGSPEVSGYQADIGEKGWGDLYDESRRRKVLAKAAPGLDKALHKEGWNSYTIRAVGNRIVLVLNGVTTVDYEEPDAAIPRAGIIALQIHSGPKLRVEFRNIRIRELKPGS